VRVFVTVGGGGSFRGGGGGGGLSTPVKIFLQVRKIANREISLHVQFLSSHRPFIYRLG